MATEISYTDDWKLWGVGPYCFLFYKANVEVWMFPRIGSVVRKRDDSTFVMVTEADYIEEYLLRYAKLHEEILQQRRTDQEELYRLLGN